MAGKETILMAKKAQDAELQPKDAVQMLMEYSGFRTTKDKLEKVYSGDNLRAVLTEGLLANNPEKNRDAVDRNVRNWLNSGKDIDRNTVFEIAFILNLDIKATGLLLAMFTDEGLHWREPGDIILGYARMKGMSWPEARQLKERLGNVEAKADSRPIARDNMTTFVRDAVLNLKDEKELEDYLRASADVLGSFHNTAFMLFTKFMQLLEAPERIEVLDEIKDQKMSVREVLRMYLYRELVPTRKKGGDSDSGLTKSQKALFAKVKEGWPDEASISKMKNREIDVTRKVLILLFLATDGAGLRFGMTYDRKGNAVNYATIADQSRARLDRMLGGCGYGRLDPRIAFDWIVLYCLNVDYIEDTDSKMAETLAELFTGGEVKADAQ